MPRSAEKGNSCFLKIHKKNRHRSSKTRSDAGFIVLLGSYPDVIAEIIPIAYISTDRIRNTMLVTLPALDLEFT